MSSPSYYVVDNTFVDRISEVVEPDTTITESLPLKHYFIDCIILSSIAFGMTIFASFYDPVRQGFFCNDASIRYVYKPSSVNMFELVCYVLISNVFSVFVIESYRLQKPVLVDEFYSCYEYGRTRTKRLVVRAAIFLGHFFTCLLVVYILTTLTKYSVGRLRPHFMDVCQPNIGYKTCNTTAYITDYECTTGLVSLIKEARLSFFSGHSSTAFCAATFFCIYLQDRLSDQLRHRVIVLLLQTLVISVGLLICYTRINDNYHHWSDVLIGCIVGVFVTCVMYKWFVGFKRDASIAFASN